MERQAEAVMLESLVTLVKSLDPSSQGAVAFLVVLGIFALRLFPKPTPVRVKLAVFFTLVGFAGGGLVYSGRNARLQAEKADPHDKAGTPHPMAATVGAVIESLDLTGVAQAADGSGWIFVGKYDAAGRRWVEGPTVALRDPGHVPQPGDPVQTVTATSVYDDQPRFNLFSQSWKLGNQRYQLPAGRRLAIEDKPVFVGQNVWCRVREP
jgi:hypothetical protein